MLGLISIGPVSPSSGWKEWVQNQVLSKGLYLGFKSYSVHQLLGRYFTEVIFIIVLLMLFWILI